MSEKLRIVGDWGVLEADMQFGEGSIRLSHEFDNEDDLIKADVVLDWISELEQYYDVLQPGASLAQQAGTEEPVAIDPEDPNLEGRN